jgi:uncharacterized protein (TIGR00730 family)
MPLTQPHLRSICVFCGSSFGANPLYRSAAAEAGRVLANRRLTMVYGGANVGLMGTLADAALAQGGRVVGVLPSALVELEIAHQGLNELHFVNSMHERKRLMFDLSDAFLALPGGFGTLDELFEILTWGQLGMHTKPIALLNIAGYIDALLALLDHMVEERLLRPEHRGMLMTVPTIESALNAMESYQPVQTGKWIDRAEG